MQKFRRMGIKRKKIVVTHHQVGAGLKDIFDDMGERFRGRKARARSHKADLDVEEYIQAMILRDGELG